MDTKLENLKNTYVDGKRVNYVEVTTTYSKSDDMAAKANLEMELANYERKKEEIEETLKGQLSAAERERLLKQLEYYAAAQAETREKITVQEGYIAGYGVQ